MAIIVNSRSFKDAIYAIGIILGILYGFPLAGTVNVLINDIWGSESLWKTCSASASLLGFEAAIIPVIFYHLLWFDREGGLTRTAGIIRTCKIFGIITLPLMMLPMATSLSWFYADTRRFGHFMSGQFGLSAAFVYWIVACYLIARQLGPLRKILGFEVAPPKAGWALRQAGKLMLITTVPLIYFNLTTGLAKFYCSPL